MKRIISICVLLFSSAIAFSAEFSLKIEFPEMGETLDPFVTIINEQGENTVIANKNGAQNNINSNGVKIIRTNDFGDVFYKIVLDDNISNECVIWLNNSFQVDDYNIGNELFDTEIVLSKNNVSIGNLSLANEQETYNIKANLNGRNIKEKIFPKNSSGLWKVCSIIPKYDKVLWLNSFYVKSRIIEGKVWNTAMRKPAKNAEIFSNGIKVAQSDENGDFIFSYNFSDTSFKIYAKYKTATSNTNSILVHDEFPRIVNLNLAYQTAPPKPVNFRKTFYINFAYNSDIIEDNEQNRKIFKEILSIIKSYKIDGMVTVEGHTDNVGSRNYNYDLSYKRANSVVAFFEKLNLKKNLFSIEGFGEDRPLETNSTEVGRSKNRRVEIVFNYIKVIEE